MKPTSARCVVSPTIADRGFNLSIEYTNIMGVNVISGDPRAIVSLLDARIAGRVPTRVAFLNAHLSNLAAGDHLLERQLERFFVLNDGIGVDLARRALHGSAFPHNLNGTDFTPDFLDRTGHLLRIFLLGGRSDVIEQASRIVANRWEHHRVVGFHDGYFTPRDTLSIRSKILATSPDVLLVGLGSPLQEAWIADHVPDVCPCAFAIGAWFDFVSRRVPRAPDWMRRRRLEWAFRLGLEPDRLWRRYLSGNAAFLARVARSVPAARRELR